MAWTGILVKVNMGFVGWVVPRGTENTFLSVAIDGEASIFLGPSWTGRKFLRLMPGPHELRLMHLLMVGTDGDLETMGECSIHTQLVEGQVRTIRPLGVGQRRLTKNNPMTRIRVN